MQKKSIFQKISVCVLAFLIGAGGAACTREESSTSDTPQEIVSTVTKDENHTFFANGQTNYQIVVADDATSNEQMAASELDYFFYLSTSKHLEIVSESSRTSEYYFSVGQTDLLNESGIEYDEEKLGDSGFKIVSKDYNVYFIGSSYGKGCIYAIYEYLEYVLDYECYASDEYSVSQLSSVPFYHADLEEIPTFQKRNVSSPQVREDSNFANRMRFNDFGNRMYISVHSEFSIIPPEQYKDKSHWFGAGGKHLCYSQEDMKAEFVNNIKEDIVSNTVANMIQIGLMDVNTFCGCTKCLETIAKYGTESAVMVLFVNDVVAQINEWIEITYPNRHIEFMLLAYQKTVTAPATKQSDGTFKPNAPELKFEKNLAVYIADQAVDYASPMDGESNKGRLDIVRAWASLGPVYVYGYSLNFYHSFVNAPDYLAFAHNYEVWKDSGVTAVSDEGGRWQTPTFTALRTYLRSELMWDYQQNFDETVQKFMKGYYKEAAEGMYEYFTLVSTWSRTLSELYPGAYGNLYFNYDTKHFPKYVVDGFHAAIKKAYAAIEPLKTTDKAKYDKLFDRIKTEEISVLYIQMWANSSYFTRTEKIAMIDDLQFYCTKLSILYPAMQVFTSTIFETLSAWRASL